MAALIDSFWRASLYLLHPRVLLLSVLPLLISASLAVVLGHFFWDNAAAAVQRLFQSWALLQAMFDWLDAMGAGSVRTMLAPAILATLALLVLVVMSLLLVSLLMTPALVKLVAGRRFPQLQRLHGASFWQSLWYSVASSAVALVLLVISLPLWLVPPLVLVVPPVIWGWLTYRVMSFDALAEHATAAERRAVMRASRWPLLGMGVVCGYLGAAPALIWAVSAVALILAPFLILVSVWLYTLVFAFSALWFAHYTLWRLEQLRESAAVARNSPELSYRETS